MALDKCVYSLFYRFCLEFLFELCMDDVFYIFRKIAMENVSDVNLHFGNYQGYIE